MKRSKSACSAPAIILYLAASVTRLFPVNFVTPDGSAAPERDQPTRPWQLVEAAARALPIEGGTVSISPGIYREKLVLDSPAVLIAPSGGVVIGDLTSGISAIGTFHVLTWNLHLFGDIITFPLRWQDYPRAEEIGGYFARRFPELDLVSLCEIWDEDLFTGGGGAPGIRPLSGYSNWMIFTDIKSGFAFCEPLAVPLIPRVLHSGLALMSKHPMTDLHRVHYETCAGNCPLASESPDCLASKGFIATTVVKDGFAIRVYDTHTQAGYGEDYVKARGPQIVQLAKDIAASRAAHPDQMILVMGDMNIIGEDAAGHNTTEYNFLRDQFGALGGHDAARHAANISIYGDPNLGHTLTSFNELAIHFDPPHNERLDYVWYFPSLDGKVRLQPTYVERLLLRGASRTEADLTSDELSDHYPIEASFQLVRLP